MKVKVTQNQFDLQHDTNFIYISMYIHYLLIVIPTVRQS